MKWNSKYSFIFNKQDRVLSISVVAGMNTDVADNRSWMLFRVKIHLVSNLEYSGWDYNACKYTFVLIIERGLEIEVLSCLLDNTSHFVCIVAVVCY